MKKWTEASDEIIEFMSNNHCERMVTEYFSNNIKKWTFYTKEKDKEPVAVFESFFDMSYFVK